MYVLAAIMVDFLLYWQHRIHHEVALLWTIHNVHHSSPWMNFTHSFSDQLDRGGLSVLCFSSCRQDLPPLR
ncbi:MAG: sterol desaturase family protein [Bacteroidia bacterium]